MVERNASTVDEVEQHYCHINLIVEHSMLPSWLHLDMSVVQIRVLYILSAEGLLSISQLAERLTIGISAASHLVDRLVRSGYVIRSIDEADRRRTLINLTPRGHHTILSLRDQARNQFRNLASQLEQEDLQALQQGLRALMRVSRSEVVSR